MQRRASSWNGAGNASVRQSAIMEDDEEANELYVADGYGNRRIIVFDAETGARYRREILAVGGSRPALESFIAFRGREPQPEALLRSHGLAA